MTVASILVIGLVVALLLWGFFSKSPPAENALEDPNAVPHALEWLLKRGVKGSRVEFRCRNIPGRAVVVRKYLEPNLDRGLRCSVDSSIWPESTLLEVSAELKRRGVAHTAVTESDRFVLTVDFGSDIGLAHLVTRIILAALLSRAIEKDCVALYHDVLHIKNVPRLTGSAE